MPLSCASGDSRDSEYLHDLSLVPLRFLAASVVAPEASRKLSGPMFLTKFSEALLRQTWLGLPVHSQATATFALGILDYQIQCFEKPALRQVETT